MLIMFKDCTSEQLNQGTDMHVVGTQLSFCTFLVCFLILLACILTGFFMQIRGFWIWWPRKKIVYGQWKFVFRIKCPSIHGNSRFNSLDRIRFRHLSWVHQSSKIQVVGKVTWSNFCPEDPQILGSMIENVVAWMAWHPGFVHSLIEDVLRHFISIASDSKRKNVG